MEALQLKRKAPSSKDRASKDCDSSFAQETNEHQCFKRPCQGTQNSTEHKIESRVQKKLPSGSIDDASSALPSLAQKSKVVRIQRKGAKIVQDCDVYIGRAWNMGGWKLPKSKWANPFSVKQSGTATKAVERYREYVMSSPKLLADLGELQGKTLGCWCKPGPCHGDVLVQLLEHVGE